MHKYLWISLAFWCACLISIPFDHMPYDESFTLAQIGLIWMDNVFLMEIL